LRGKRKPARSGQIGGFSALRQFADDRGNAACLQRLFHCPKRFAWARRPHHKQPRKGKPEEIAAKPVKLTPFERGEILLHKDDASLPRRCERRQRQRKTQSRAAMAGACRGKLVQLFECKAAFERRIGRTKGKKISRSAAPAPAGWVSYYSNPFTLGHF
jgi:hypothetical protein